MQYSAPKRPLNVSVLDIVVFIENVRRGAEHSEVGFADANETVQTMCAKLNKVVQLPEEVVESALWSCNLMDEAGIFWHPTDRKFSQWLKDLERIGKFDFETDYNLIRRDV
jgi:hypothetical protein